MSRDVAPALNEAILTSVIRESLSTNFGDAGWARVGSSLNVKYCSPATRLCIVRTSRDTANLVRAALSLVRQIKSQDCLARVVHISGTIRKTQQVAVVFDRQLIMAAVRNPQQVQDLLSMSKQAINKLNP